MIQEYVKQQVTSCIYPVIPILKTNVTQKTLKSKQEFSLDSENTGQFLFPFLYLFVISKFSTIEQVNFFKDVSA